MTLNKLIGHDELIVIAFRRGKLSDDFIEKDDESEAVDSEYNVLENL